MTIGESIKIFIIIFLFLLSISSHFGNYKNMKKLKEKDNKIRELKRENEKLSNELTVNIREIARSGLIILNRDHEIENLAKENKFLRNMLAQKWKDSKSTTEESENDNEDNAQGEIENEE